MLDQGWVIAIAGQDNLLCNFVIGLSRIRRSYFKGTLRNLLLLFLGLGHRTRKRLYSGLRGPNSASISLLCLICNHRLPVSRLRS